MKVISSLILLLFVFSFCSAQSDSQKPHLLRKGAPVRPVFNTQGEWEDYQAGKFFEENYERHFYQRFKGTISVLSETAIKYDDKVLEIYNTSASLMPIFKKGIFYANIITGNEPATVAKTKEELHSLPPDQKILYSLGRTDSTRISNFEELKFLHNSPEIKRFRFWLYRPGMANPQVYFIELTNEQATAQTDMTSFINGATLTFFKAGWIII